MSTSTRWQSIIRIRTRRRDTAAESVRKAEQAINILDSHVGEIQSEIEQIDRKRAADQIGRINVDAMLESQRYSSVLFSQLAYLNQQKSKLEQERERRQKLLLTAQQELEAITKLEEKRIELEKVKEEKRNQESLDAWSITRETMARRNVS